MRLTRFTVNIAEKTSNEKVVEFKRQQVHLLIGALGSMRLVFFNKDYGVCADTLFPARKAKVFLSRCFYVDE